LVLKIYKSEDMKSYLKEIAVLKKLEEMKKRSQINSDTDEVVGFPEMISHLEG